MEATAAARCFCRAGAFSRAAAAGCTSPVSTSPISTAHARKRPPRCYPPPLVSALAHRLVCGVTSSPFIVSPSTPLRWWFDPLSSAPARRAVWRRAPLHNLGGLLGRWCPSHPKHRLRSPLGALRPQRRPSRSELAGGPHCCLLAERPHWVCTTRRQPQAACAGGGRHAAPRAPHDFRLLAVCCTLLHTRLSPLALASHLSLSLTHTRAHTPAAPPTSRLATYSTPSTSARSTSSCTPRATHASPRTPTAGTTSSSAAPARSSTAAASSFRYETAH